MNKKIAIPLIIVLALAGTFLFGRFVLRLGGWEYDSYEDFKKNAYLKLTVDIPAGATDQKFYYKNVGLGERSLYAFTLNSTDYNKFIRSMEIEHNLICDPEDYAKYGCYAEYYMKKVKDIQYPDDPIDSFPMNLDYDKVVSGDISNYDVIIYSPMYSGSTSWGMIANPGTGRIVVFSIGNIK